MKIFIATANKHKKSELLKILPSQNNKGEKFKYLTFLDFPNLTSPEENALTLKENALIKARALQKVTTMPIISDDTGLEILSMDNKPGLHTARYAESLGGHQEAFKDIFKNIEGKDRSATFVCDIVLLNVEDKPLRFEARIPGHIAESVKGESGFGYDPIFICDEVGKTYASLTSEEKNRVSHRGKALKKLVTYLKINNLIY